MDKELIKELRRIKRDLYNIYKIEVGYIDAKGETITDSEELKKIYLLSKSIEGIERVIYQIIEREYY